MMGFSLSLLAFFAVLTLSKVRFFFSPQKRSKIGHIKRDRSFFTSSYIVLKIIIRLKFCELSIMYVCKICVANHSFFVRSVFPDAVKKVVENPPPRRSAGFFTLQILIFRLLICMCFCSDVRRGIAEFCHLLLFKIPSISKD
jgi:small-conductance mechanosensitive channel